MQRPAKTYRAAMGNDGRVDLRQIIHFAKSAAEALEREGQGESAFYFEQLADWLETNPQKGLDETVGRILGL